MDTLILVMRLLITIAVGSGIIIFIMKNVWEISRDERNHKIKNLLIKVISCELLLIATIFLTIFLTNSQPTVPLVLLAIGTALFFSWPLLFAAIQIGIHIRDGYTLLEKKSPLMEFLRPWAEIKVAGVTEESVYY